jgi:hypothetical protein
MRHVAILRVLILTDLVLILLEGGAHVALIARLPESLQTHARAQLDSSSSFHTAIGDIYLIVFFGALVVAWVGLWKLQRWARGVYTAVCVVGLVITLFHGTLVTHAVAAVLYSMASITTGMLLGLIWFSDLGAEFERRA